MMRIVTISVYVQTIKRCRDEEEEHHDIGLEHEAEKVCICMHTYVHVSYICSCLLCCNVRNCDYIHINSFK